MRPQTAKWNQPTWPLSFLDLYCMCRWHLQPHKYGIKNFWRMNNCIICFSTSLVSEKPQVRVVVIQTVWLYRHSEGLWWTEHIMSCPQPYCCVQDEKWSVLECHLCMLCVFILYTLTVDHVLVQVLYTLTSFMFCSIKTVDKVDKK